MNRAFQYLQEGKVAPQGPHRGIEGQLPGIKDQFRGMHGRLPGVVWQKPGLRSRPYGLRPAGSGIQTDDKEDTRMGDRLSSSREGKLAMAQIQISCMTADRRTAWGIPTEKFTEYGTCYGTARAAPCKRCATARNATTCRPSSAARPSTHWKR